METSKKTLLQTYTGDFRVAVADIIKELMLEMEKEYGWTFTEEELANTPTRVASFYEEWANNQKYSKMTTFIPEYSVDEMIVVSGTRFASLCSHHLLPFFGTIDVVYLPREKIFGLSKIPRLILKKASQPQTQEKLTQDIADFIEKELQPRAVLVVSHAVHTCMAIRGVKQPNAETTVSVALGEFRTNVALKEEALKLLQ